MANLVNSQQASSKLFISCLIVLVLSASCLSPYYSRAQQLVVGLQQRGIEFIVDSPVLAATSPLFPHELFTSLLFSYVRWKDVSGPPDVLPVYTAPTMDQADYAESRIRDYAQAFYGLRGVDLPLGSVQYYRCDETIVVHGAFGQRGLDPAVDKAFTDMCGPEFVRYPLEK